MIKPDNPETLRGPVIKRLRNHDLPTRAARNTAMINAITELPPIVVSDLFGLSASTAFQWAKFAQQNWTDYLALQCAVNEQRTR